MKQYEWWKYHKIDVPIGEDVDKIQTWCTTHVGDHLNDWAIAGNAHAHIIFIKDYDKSVMFALRWK